MGQPRKGLFLFGNIKELNYICPMQPKAKFWVDFFNYLFRVVTFKKIIPQPRKTKRKNYHVALSRMHINFYYVNVENPNETELQNLGEGEVSKIRNSYTFNLLGNFTRGIAVIGLLIALFDYIY